MMNERVAGSVEGYARIIVDRALPSRHAINRCGFGPDLTSLTGVPALLIHTLNAFLIFFDPGLENTMSTPIGEFDPDKITNTRLRSGSKPCCRCTTNLISSSSPRA